LYYSILRSYFKLVIQRERAMVLVRNIKSRLLSYFEVGNRKSDI
jgi:hypothetical protein